VPGCVALGRTQQNQEFLYALLASDSHFSERFCVSSWKAFGGMGTLSVISLLFTS
jgi:hypothetical protein